MHRWKFRLEARSSPALRLWLSLGFAALGCVGCGSESPESDSLPIDPEPLRPAGAERFSALQPESGDTLVPPRLGFRWEYRDVGAAPTATDPETMESARDDVRFRLQVLDAAGAIHADLQTTDRNLLITLPPSSGQGLYTWWLEAYAAGDSGKVAESERSEFELR